MTIPPGNLFQPMALMAGVEITKRFNHTGYIMCHKQGKKDPPLKNDLCIMLYTWIIRIIYALSFSKIAREQRNAGFRCKAIGVLRPDNYC
ncbi:MAG: hypothetical protein DRN37_07455 [Thermoplasmata archaeon]|nr:MAG: hypothetical protein DRN37_07455 [Thermoplasmata archaeon]